MTRRGRVVALLAALVALPAAAHHSWSRYDGDNVTMKVAIWQKDMKVIGDYAQRIGVPTPTFSACEPIYNAAMSTGHAGDDTASVCAVLEAMAGLRR